MSSDCGLKAETDFLKKSLRASVENCPMSFFILMVLRRVKVLKIVISCQAGGMCASGFPEIFVQLSNKHLYICSMARQTKQLTKHMLFPAIASLIVLSCGPRPGVQVNYLEPVLYIGRENRVEAEITMSEPIDKIRIVLKYNKKLVYVDESDIEYSSNRKTAAFSTKLMLPEGTQLGKDSILIGAESVNNKLVDNRWSIWIAYPD